MKKYFNFEELMENELPLLREYAHILQIEKPIEGEYKQVFYLKKPQIYVCVTKETNESNLRKMFSKNDNE